MLTLQDFSCERDNRLLFCGLNARFDAGEVWHLEGPNGVGKTSLLRQLTGISREYGGRLLWRGQDVRAVRYDFASSLLYIGHQPGVKKVLSPRENLRAYCPLADEARLEWALAQMGLYGFEDVGSYRLSAGQTRRVALARLLLSESPLWVLDEPYTALDVHAVAALEQRFAQHAAAGGCVILTSHQACGLANLKTLNLGDFVPAFSREVAHG